MPKNKHKEEVKEMDKFGVACSCPHDKRPSDAELELQEDGSYLCPQCGRKWKA